MTRSTTTIALLTATSPTPSRTASICPYSQLPLHTFNAFINYRLHTTPLNPKRPTSAPQTYRDTHSNDTHINNHHLPYKHPNHPQRSHPHEKINPRSNARRFLTMRIKEVGGGWRSEGLGNWVGSWKGVAGRRRIGGCRWKRRRMFHFMIRMVVSLMDFLRAVQFLWNGRFGVVFGVTTTHEFPLPLLSKMESVSVC